MKISTDLAQAVQPKQIAAPAIASVGQGASGEDFAKTLMDVIKGVEDTGQKAQSLQDDLLTGRRHVEYHDVMIAMEKASMALNLTIAVRNKLLDAYQQISQTQI